MGLETSGSKRGKDYQMTADEFVDFLEIDNGSEAERAAKQQGLFDITNFYSENFPLSQFVSRNDYRSFNDGLKHILESLKNQDSKYADVVRAVVKHIGCSQSRLVSLEIRVGELREQQRDVV